MQNTKVAAMAVASSAFRVKSALCIIVLSEH
jgi:hypothetical protein